MFEDIKEKTMKYYEDGNGLIRGSLDDSTLAPTNSQFKPKQTIEFVTPDQNNKYIFDYEYKYISDNKF